MLSKFIYQIELAREICQKSKNSLETKISELNNLRLSISTAIHAIKEKYNLNITKREKNFKTEASEEIEFVENYNQIMKYASKAIILLTDKLTAENKEFLNEMVLSSFVIKNTTEPCQIKENEDKPKKPVELKFLEFNDISIKNIDIPIGQFTKVPCYGIDAGEPMEQKYNIFDGIDKIPLSAPKEFILFDSVKKLRAEKKYGHIIAVEGPGERRKFFNAVHLEEVIEFLDKCQGACDPLHEYVEGNCRFFCDLDDKDAVMSRLDFVRKINLICHYFPLVFGKVFNIENFTVDPYISISENPNYNSAHIYFDIKATNLERVSEISSICVETMATQGLFWKKFDYFLNSHTKFNCSIIDFAVYRNGTQIRLPGTRKNGYLLKPYGVAQDFYLSRDMYENAYKRKDELMKVEKKKSEKLTDELLSCKSVERSHIITKFPKNLWYSKECVEQCRAVDEKYEQLIKQNEEKLEYQKFSIFVNDILDRSFLDSRFCHAAYGRTFSASSEYLIKEGEKLAFPMVYETQYDKILFERVLQQSTLIFPSLDQKDKNFSVRNSLLRSAVFRIFCFYHQIGGAYRIVRQFLESRGMNICSRLDSLIRSFFRCWTDKCQYHHFTMDSNMKFFKYEGPKAIKIETDRITYGDFKGITCIKSGTGTGKTYGFIKKYKDEKCLYISCKVSLADEFKRTASKQGINMVHYKDSEINDIYIKYKSDGTVPQHFCVQINSLHKFAHMIGAYDNIFIDESEALFGCFTHILETDPKNICLTKASFNEIMKKNVVFCSANMSERTFMFIEDYGRPYIFINNLKKDKEDYSVVECSHDGFFASLEKLVKENKKVSIACNSRKIAIQIDLFIKQINPEAKVLKQTSLDEKEEVDDWDKYDYLVHTSTIETGVSFTAVHFDNIMGYFKSGVNTFDSCYQMLFRVRYPKNKKIFLFSQHGRALKSADRMDLERASRQISLQTNEIFHTEAKIKDFNSFAYSNMRDPIDKVLLRNIFVRGHSETYFKKLLFGELKKAGIKFEKNPITAKPELTIGSGIIKKEVNKQMINTGVLISLGIDEKDFIMPETTGGASIETVIHRTQSFMNLQSYKTDKKVGLNNKEIAVNIFLQVLEQNPNGSFEDNDLEGKLNAIFENNYDAMSACFNRRKYTLEEMLKRDLQRKVQFVAPILRSAGYDIKKVDGQYSIFAIGYVQDIIKQVQKKKFVNDI